MSIPPLTVRPIVHTDHRDTWITLLRALGADQLADDPMWTVLQLDRGRIVVTALNRDAVEGEVALGFETPDLAAYAAAVRPMPGMVVEPFATADYTSLRVAGRDGLELLVDEEPGRAPVPAPATSVHAMWVTTDVEGTAEDLEALGLRRRLSQVNGRVVDLRAGEGDVLVHVDDGAPVGADVSVDVPDVEVAHHALLDAGIAHDVIDETHGRTLQVPMPGERTFWIVQEDDDPVGVVRDLSASR